MIMSVILFTLIQPGDAAMIEARLDVACGTYDLNQAAAIVDETRPSISADSSPDTRVAFAKALLLVAELCRIDYEQLPADARTQRRALGERIDAAAQEALAQLDQVDETSEVQRLRGDLYGTMIRTDYQAKKYKKLMDAAIARALETDPDNLRAQFSAVKPFVFADTTHGRDLDKAVSLLDKILAREPGFEQARLLRAFALEQSGRTSEAISEWRRVLEANPACKPAEVALKKYETASSGRSGKE